MSNDRANINGINKLRFNLSQNRHFVTFKVEIIHGRLPSTAVMTFQFVTGCSSHYDVMLFHILPIEVVEANCADICASHKE